MTNTLMTDSSLQLLDALVGDDHDGNVVCTLIAEVLNGGFEQWITNSHTEDLDEFFNDAYCALTGWDCPHEFVKILLDVWRLRSADANAPLDSYDTRFYTISSEVIDCACKEWDR